ncbi:MAG: penicillin acylase family protein [Planctomycetales bacterium]|nr:penicillin acylase family protein [Planctomycetales bacterium]
MTRPAVRFACVVLSLLAATPLVTETSVRAAEVAKGSPDAAIAPASGVALQAGPASDDGVESEGERAAGNVSPEVTEQEILARLAKAVTIHRDEYGVPHIFGKDDASTLFGFGYAQAENDFWLLEDAYILALGRYCEAHGPRGMNSDLLNRAFEVVPRSRRDFAAMDAASQHLCEAFVRGINYYLQTHPEVRPRMLARFEAWQVLAYYRHVALELCFRLTGLSTDYVPRRNPTIWAATGSNGWAVSGERTHDGRAMLLANPHMPWFGFAQLAEAHLCSGQEGQPDSWNFIGAGFVGCPTLALGHNERLGWTLVTNEPDIADVWRVRFDDPSQPLAYAYDGQHRLAEEWTENVRVRKGSSFEDRQFTFRKTHHGPVVAKEDDGSMLTAQISGLFETVPLRQSLRMIRSRNLNDFREALGGQQILFMNVLYADCDGNIYYLYNGRIPRRNPSFDWSQPVDGSDPAASWLGIHDVDELPHVLNPAAGFVQNCNSSPASTTDGDNPDLTELPAYFARDAQHFNRRSQRSLEILRGMHRATFEEWQAAAFDTEVYWARHELPRYAKALETLRHDQPALAAQVRPYLDHLLAWDGRITDESTAATLCHAWYEQLYGPGYPGETLLPSYEGDDAKQLAALGRAADRLYAMHGDWKMPYGEVFRIQRAAAAPDLASLRFDDDARSLPSVGGHGPMGVVFTQYYSPSVDIPLFWQQRKRYGVVGTSYLAAYQFGPEGARGVSLTPFGTSGDPRSEHFFDQAQLLSQRRMKPERFTRSQALRHAVESYQPGELRTKKSSKPDSSREQSPAAEISPTSDAEPAAESLRTATSDVKRRRPAQEGIAMVGANRTGYIGVHAEIRRSLWRDAQPGRVFNAGRRRVRAGRAGDCTDPTRPGTRRSVVRSDRAGDGSAQRREKRPDSAHADRGRHRRTASSAGSGKAGI